MKEICKRPTDTSNEGPGDSCPECGHTSMVHPGNQNPTVEECPICALIVLVNESYFAVSETLKTNQKRSGCKC